MIYHIVYKNWDIGWKRHSGPKGLGDISAIMRANGIKEVIIPAQRKTQEEPGLFSKLVLQFKIFSVWQKACKNVTEGDWLIVEMPQFERFVFFRKTMKLLKKRGVNICYFLVDLETFRKIGHEGAGRLKRRLILSDENYVLRSADKLLVHNSVYKKRLESMDVSCPMHCFELFDYLTGEVEFSKRNTEKDGAVVVAANFHPEKAGFVKELPDNYCYNLYGINYCGEESDNIKYYGSFDPECLMNEIKGSYGLVWDGDSIDGCRGVYGDYMRVNTPHKLSFYLACGIPVIVWKQSAMSGFVAENKCGFAIDNLNEINAVIKSMSETDYTEMKNNAERIGEKLRTGYYTTTVLKEAFGNALQKQECSNCEK